MKGRRTLRGIIAALLCAMLLLACIPLGAAETATPDEAACSHPDIDVYERFVGPSTYTDGAITPTTHVAVKARVQITWCRTCNEVLEEKELEPAELVESHSFNGGNTCSTCGYVKVEGCEHASCHWEERYSSNGRLEPLNAKEHGYPNGMWTNYYVCDVCGEIQLDAEHQPENLRADTKAEPHEFEDGACWKCDLEQCTHPNTPVEDVLTKVTCVSLGYTQHSMIVDEWSVKQCPDCGAVFSSVQTKEAEETTQEHSFEDGVCTLCGQAACTHGNAVVTTELINRRGYQPVEGGEKHSFIADVVRTSKCPDCGEGSTGTVTDQPQEEDHQFDESGRCALCGYCDHRNRTVTQTPIEGTDTYADNGDGRTHTHSWRVHRLVVCPNCGTLEDADVAEPESEPENHTFANGYCIHCDAECPHTDGFAYEGKHFDWRNSQVIRYNDEVHVISVNMIANRKCSTCGKVIEYNAVVEAGVQVTEPHAFGEDGSCLQEGCGAQNSCQHNGATHTESFEDYEGQVKATCVDDQYHSIPGFKVTQTICDLCGAVIGETREDVEVLEKHYIRNGVCTFLGCGYEGEECRHEHQGTDTEEIMQRNQQSIGHDQHEYYVDVVKYVGCDDCMTLLSEEILQENLRKVEDHEFVNGVCVICGETEHPSRTTKQEYGQMNSFAPIDAQTHSFLADVYEVVTCADCGEQISRKLIASAAPQTGSHEFGENGRCVWCGYCQHRTTTQSAADIPGSERYTNSGDGKTHVKTWDVQVTTTCSVCGEQVGVRTEEDSAQESHRYEGGMCICGAACPHEETVQTSRRIDWSTATLSAYNDRVHVYTADIVVNLACGICGQTVERGVVVEENVELVERHEFDAEGNCYAEGCGATNTCVHNGATHTVELVEPNGEYQATCVDDVFHSVPALKMTITVCDLCGSAIGEVDEDVEMLELHTIRDGRCSAPGCGYEGTGCQHTDTVQALEDVLQRNQRSTGHDGHEYTVDVQQVTTCTTCGRTLSCETVETNVRRTGEHDFVNGLCGVCGGAEHPNRTTTQEYGQMDIFEPIDAQTHSFLADVYEVVTCADCGEQISRTLIASAARQTGSHEFGENGRCVWCGYCQHRTTAQSAEAVPGSERCEDSGDGRTHVKTWDVQVTTTCTVCGQQVGETKTVQESEQEPHDHSSGACICGRACPHENTKVPYQGFDLDNAEVVSYNEVSHTLRTNIVGNVICQSCYRIVEEKVFEENVTFSESHELDSEGRCVYCGYVPTCPHEHIGEDVEYDAGGNTVIEWDEQGHTVAASKTVWTYCEDCGTLLSRTRTTTEPMKLPHRFVKGIDTCVAYGCEAKNECQHGNTEEKIYETNGRNHVSLGSGEHQYEADIIRAVYCADCGVQLSREVVEEKVVLTEEHGFLKGVCVSCGESEPLPTATPDEATPVPTVKPTPAPTPTPTSAPEDNDEPTSRPNRTPAPVVTPVATAAPTVAPTSEPEKKPIVETLFEAIAEAEAEGKEVEVEIVGAQEVMTQEEYTELRALTAQEQVLVTLKTVGLDEVVQAAVAAMNVTVSGEAQSLMDKVGARQETMTAEERTAYEDKLAEYFPVTERVIGGVTVRTFTIDMKVVVDGYERVERYQFYLDENGEWVFEKVDLASFGRA